MIYLSNTIVLACSQVAPIKTRTHTFLFYGLGGSQLFAWTSTDRLKKTQKSGTFYMREKLLLRKKISTE